MSVKPVISRNDLWRQVKQTGSWPARLLFAADKAGHLWMTNSYWMIRADVFGPAISNLLAEFNLRMEPMCCEVSRRSIIRSESDPPDVDALLVKFKKGRKPLTRYTIGDEPVFVSEERRAVFARSDGRREAFDAGLLAFVVRTGFGGAWEQGAPNTPAAYIVDGSHVGSLMPVRMTDLFTAAEGDEAAA